MLKRVSIQNFKSLKDVTLELQKVNLLIGPNNSGKTNFLKALQYFSKNIYKNIDKQSSLFPKNISLDESYVFKKNLNNKLYIHTVFNEKNLNINKDDMLFSRDIEYQHFRLKSEGDNYYYEHWYSNNQNINTSSFYGREYTISTEYTDDYFKGMEAFTINPNLFVDSYPLSPNNQKIYANTSNLVAFLDTLRDKYPDNFKQIEHDINKLIPEFSELRFDTVVPNKDLKKRYGDKTYKKIGLYSSQQKLTYWADELSEGTLYFTALLCIIHQPNPPKLLLLEEPEKGIHPRRIYEVIEFIFRLAEDKDIQVIMTTHSPIVLDMFKDMPESVFIFDKDDEGATHVKNLQRDVIEPDIERSKEYGLEPPHYTDALGDSWTIGFLGGVPK